MLSLKQKLIVFVRVIYISKANRFSCAMCFMFDSMEQIQRYTLALHSQERHAMLRLTPQNTSLESTSIVHYPLDADRAGGLDETVCRTRLQTKIVQKAVSSAVLVSRPSTVRSEDTVAAAIHVAIHAQCAAHVLLERSESAIMHFYFLCTTARNTTMDNEDIV